MSILQKPRLSYNGGKSGNGTFQTIINQIPQCTTFIDAMVGNGGIVCHLKLPDLTVINDIDSAVIDGFIFDGSHQILKENIPVWDLIDKYDRNGHGTFFYFDPPYLKSTRKSQLDLYKYEWTLEDHHRFLSKVLTVKSNCMISHYPCDIYDSSLSHWRKIKFQSMTRHGLATEAIYMNYPEPTTLQDYRYIGKDFIDRQRIKRKCHRLIKKIESLPIHERALIVSTLKSKFP